MLALPAWAQEMKPDPAFNPNFIIADNEITDSHSMSVDQIQRFLELKGSALASHICFDGNGMPMLASTAIYNVSQSSGINPKFILVLLQKEQGLVEDNSPKQSQLDWATGYGCPDGGGCNARWKGLWKQINSASLQFKDYLENPQLYKFKQGGTYTFSNPYSTTVKDTVTVTPSNTGTAALYNYTPHVYNGNYNFWNLWRRYFTKLYPSGTLLQAVGEPGVWLVEGGQRRAIMARGALTSRFDAKKIITVKKSDLMTYEIGTPIKFPQYSIVHAPSGSLYLLIDDRKRLFVSKEAFRKLGYNPEEIMEANIEDLASYKDGLPITEKDAYPTGALLADAKSGAVYWVEGQTKALVADPIYLKTRFKNKKPIRASSSELAKYKTVDQIKFQNGELIKIDRGFTVYVIENNSLRPIASNDAFVQLGYNKDNVISISQKLFSSYPIGTPIGINI